MSLLGSCVSEDQKTITNNYLCGCGKRTVWSEDNPRYIAMPMEPKRGHYSKIKPISEGTDEPG